MKTTKDMIEVMQAYDDGKEIEVFINGHRWEAIKGDNVSPVWNWEKHDYRTKKEPMRVPLSSEDIKPGDCIKHKGGCNSNWDMIVSVGIYVWRAFGSEIVSTSYTDLMEDGYVIRSMGESEWRPCWKLEE